MRRAYLIGLGIGAALGTLWVVPLLTLMGKISVYRSWVNIPPWLVMILLIGALAGAVVLCVKVED